MEERRQRINNATSIQRVVEGKIRAVGGLKPTTDIYHERHHGVKSITCASTKRARRTRCDLTEFTRRAGGLIDRAGEGVYAYTWAVEEILREDVIERRDSEADFNLR